MEISDWSWNHFYSHHPTGPHTFQGDSRLIMKSFLRRFEIDHEIISEVILPFPLIQEGQLLLLAKSWPRWFSTVILSLSLIQEEQLSASEERMCTILVNRIEDYACPVKVLIGKLTALDMTLFGWLGRKTSIHSRPRWLSWMRRPTGDQEVAGSTPAEVGNILSWRLIMKYFLRSFSPFRWFKKGSCQFLAKECAQYWLTA